MRICLLLVAGLLLGADAPRPAGETAPLKVTAEKLGDAYRTNEAAADETYQGREVEVTGKVVRITKSKQGDPSYAVVLASNPAFRSDMPVVCFFVQKQRKLLVELRPDQVVTIRGRCQSRMVWSGKPGHGHDADVSEIWVAPCERVVVSKAK